MSVGKYLREAREAAGYSVEQISSKTRIRAEVIRDLECEKFQSCGGNAYARGHIRTIGQVVNADIDRLLTEFESTTGEVQRPMIDLLTENNATSVKKQRALPKMTYKFMASTAAVVVGLMILVPTATSMFKTTTNSTKSTSPKVSLANRTQSVAVSATQGVSTDSRKQQNNAAVVPTMPTNGTGNLVFSADSGTTWIAVTDAQGTNIFTGKIVKGSSQSFDASQLLNVTLGNSGAVSVTLNGKSLGYPGALGEVKYLQYGPGASSPTPAG
jgi:cytoskeletal protein RodZ